MKKQEPTPQWMNTTDLKESLSYLAKQIDKASALSANATLTKRAINFPEVTHAIIKCRELLHQAAGLIDHHVGDLQQLAFTQRKAHEADAQKVGGQ